MTILLLVFLFQSGLAYAFSYFVCRMVTGDPDARADTKIVLLKVRTGFIFLSLLLPSAMFLAFWFSLPEGRPATMAALPALWLFLILAAVVVAITRAVRKFDAESAGL